MKKYKLTAEKRKVLGRKVKKLRAEGVLPGNIYGRKVKSQAVSVDLREFGKVYEKAGETGMVDLMLKGEKKARPVLIHNVQRHAVTAEFLHADFHEVILTEKTRAGVSVKMMGKAAAVEQKLGILVQLINEIEVEALPKDMPECLEVNIRGLEKVNEAVFVKDIKVDRKKIKLLADENQMVVKIEPPQKEELEEKPEEKPVEEKPEEQKVAEGEAEDNKKKMREEKS